MSKAAKVAILPARPCVPVQLRSSVPVFFRRGEGLKKDGMKKESPAGWGSSCMSCMPLRPDTCWRSDVSRAFS